MTPSQANFKGADIIHHQTVAKVLGYFGLVPFVGLAAAVLADAQSHDAARLLAAYTFGILSFLLGSWWGISLMRRTSTTLIISNMIFLIVIAGHLLLPIKAYLVLGAATFLLILVLEMRLAAFRVAPGYYKRLRQHLSVVAATSLLVAATRL